VIRPGTKMGFVVPYRDPVALQLQMQAEGLVHLCHDLRRYLTQNRPDSFDGHRSHLLGLSL